MSKISLHSRVLWLGVKALLLDLSEGETVTDSCVWELGSMRAIFNTTHPPRSLDSDHSLKQRGLCWCIPPLPFLNSKGKKGQIKIDGQNLVEITYELYGAWHVFSFANTIVHIEHINIMSLWRTAQMCILSVDMKLKRCNFFCQNK